MGRVGKFILGGVIIGAGFALGGPLGLGIKAALISTGLSFSSQALFDALASTPHRQQVIESNQPDNQNPLPVGYGRIKVGLRVADWKVGGTDNKYFYIAGALCHGAIDGNGIAGIDEIYFDDQLAVSSDGTIQDRFRKDGSPAGAARIAFAKYLGTDSQTVDPTLTAAFPNEWPSTSKGRGIAYVMIRLESDPDVFPSGLPTVTCLVRSGRVFDPRVSQTISAIANTTPIAVTCTAPHGYSTGQAILLYESGATLQGLPTPVLGQFTATVTGANTFTLNGTSAPGVGYNVNSCQACVAAYSTNPALAVYDYLISDRYGLASLTSEIATASIVSMANYYDEVVSKDSTLGTTGKRFEANGWLDVGQPVPDNIRQLLTSCRGNLIFEGGKWRLFTRRVVAPTAYAFSEANLVGSWRFRTLGVSECPNSLRYNFTDPGAGPLVTAISISSPVLVTCASAHGFRDGQRVHIYELTPGAQGLSPARLGVYTIDIVTSSTQFRLKDSITPGAGYVNGSCRVTAEAFTFATETRYWPRPNTANSYLTEDNNYEVIADADLPFTTDPYTAEQIALVTMKEQRAGIPLEFTTDESALQLVIGDLTPFKHPTPGWPAGGDPAAGKLMWMMGMFLLPTGHVRVVGLGYDANAYTLDALTTYPPRSATSLPDPHFCIPPAGLVLTAGDAEALPDRDGSHKVYIKAVWTATTDPHIDYYEVQYRRTGDTAWLPAPDVDRFDLVAVIGPLIEGVGYDVQVRAINTIGKPSSWISGAATPTLVNARGGSFMVEDFTADAPGRRWVKIAGLGELHNVHDPDAVGYSVGRFTGPCHYEFADRIPYDATLLNVLRIRVRQLRQAVSGPRPFYLGLAGFAQDPLKPDVYVYVNTVGLNLPTEQHYVLADGVILAPSRAWTNYHAFVRGHAGGLVTLLPSQLSHAGLGDYSATNLVDGDTTPTKVGFQTNESPANSYLMADFGTDPANWKIATEAWFHMGGDDSTAEWQFEFADDPTGPWTAVPGT